MAIFRIDRWCRAGGLDGRQEQYAGLCGAFSRSTVACGASSRGAVLRGASFRGAVRRIAAVAVAVFAAKAIANAAVSLFMLFIFCGFICRRSYAFISVWATSFNMRWKRRFLT